MPYELQRAGDDCAPCGQGRWVLTKLLGGSENNSHCQESCKRGTRGKRNQESGTETIKQYTVLKMYGDNKELVREAGMARFFVESCPWSFNISRGTGETRQAEVYLEKGVDSPLLILQEGKGHKVGRQRNGHMQIALSYPVKYLGFLIHPLGEKKNVSLSHRQDVKPKRKLKLPLSCWACELYQTDFCCLSPGNSESDIEVLGGVSTYIHSFTFDNMQRYNTLLLYERGDSAPSPWARWAVVRQMQKVTAVLMVCYIGRLSSVWASLFLSVKWSSLLSLTS